MTLTIDLSPAEEARLKAAALDKGVEPEELARQLIATLPPAATISSDSTRAAIERHRGLDELAAESQKLGLY